MSRCRDFGIVFESAEQLKCCAEILNDLWRQQHWDVAHPFYEPVGTSIGTIVPCAQI
jgi:hypothetical protein